MNNDLPIFLVTYWRNKQQNDLDKGLAEQNQVMKAWAADNNYEWIASSKRDDIERKFAGILSGYGKDFRVQYKGIINGSPDGTLLFEYSNIKGEPGWGQADCDLIFQRITVSRIFIYPRDETLKFIRQEIGVPGTFDRMNGGHKPIKEWTGRKDRKDAFAYIPINLLKKHCKGIWRSL